MNFYDLLKPILFQIDPERAHNLTLELLQACPQLSSLFQHKSHEKSLSVLIHGVKWNFPIGLAAGLDKNAKALKFFENLGLGALEVGTVTPKPQEGNPKPRLFRYPEKNSLRNQMGFNNLGVQSMINELSRHQRTCPIGVNIGKNKRTLQEKAIDDYLFCLKALSPHCDYFTINLSSPNTQGLRDLQNESFLKDLAHEIQNLKKEKKLSQPLYIKLSPDLEKERLQSLCESIITHNFDGIIATNTTINKSLGPGGISGRMLKEKARECRNFLLSITRSHHSFEIIGVGGIEEVDDLLDFWNHGGKVMQVYTALIYQGPGLIKRFYNSLLKLEREGVLPEFIQ